MDHSKLDWIKDAVFIIGVLIVALIPVALTVYGAVLLIIHESLTTVFGGAFLTIIFGIVSIAVWGYLLS